VVFPVAACEHSGAILYDGSIAGLPQQLPIRVLALQYVHCKLTLCFVRAACRCVHISLSVVCHFKVLVYSSTRLLILH